MKQTIRQQKAMRDYNRTGIKYPSTKPQNSKAKDFAIGAMIAGVFVAVVIGFII